MSVNTTNTIPEGFFLIPHSEEPQVGDYYYLGSEYEWRELGRYYQCPWPYHSHPMVARKIKNKVIIE